MGLHVVVLAGGSGTRLWPMSRGALPKHLLPLGAGGRSLLRATIERVLPLGAAVWVVTVADQARRCAEELAAAGADPARVIGEPSARGTGPALGLAMHTVLREDPEAVCCSVHADHHIGGDEGYRTALCAVAGWALATGGLATIGVPPTHASTGLGYVGLGAACDPQAWTPPPGTQSDGAAARALPAHTATGFVEKPGGEVAERLVAGGEHLWNTGLFAWEAGVFLDELGQASPAIEAGTAATAAARARGDEAAAVAAYLELPSAAVDPLVLEATQTLTVVSAPFTWSDLGSWADLGDALRADGAGDDAGNVVVGDALLAGARDCLVDARGGRPVAVVGVEGVVVVDVGDAVLVLDAAQSQQVKEVVERLRAEGRGELL